MENTHIINENSCDFLRFKFVKDFNAENTENEKIIYGIKLKSLQEGEDDLWSDFRKNIPDSFNKPKGDKKIVSIDFLDVKELNARKLLCFLERVESELAGIHLIVYNIRTKLFSELKERAIANENWKTKKAILVYSYIEIKRTEDGKKDKKKIVKDRFYFADILWGSNEKKFRSINKTISLNHFNSTTVLYDLRNNSGSNKLSLPRTKSRPKPFFDTNRCLIPFDLLIKSEQKKDEKEKEEEEEILFNYNAKTLFQNEIKEGGKTSDIDNSQKEDPSELELLISFVKAQKPYKISDSHFRLGSKIHITNFFYAKPFFQNSFFAQKYALLLARDLIDSNIYSVLEGKKELTLIGYGLNSELLVSYIKIMLQNYYTEYEKKGDFEINFYTVNDMEEYLLNNPSAQLYKNAIIIVPVATTFSTSTKIEKMLKDKYKKETGEELNVLYPHRNILLVVDECFDHDDIIVKKTKEVNAKITVDKEEKEVILREYGWKGINKKEKTVKITSFDSQSNNKPEEASLIEQKYIFHLTTEWNEIKNCQYCFSDRECIKVGERDCLNPLNCPNTNSCASGERPLFDTDRASLTPELILNYPKARKINTGEVHPEAVIIEGDAIMYGHYERDLNHHHYYFNSDIFWKNNRGNVKDWLKGFKGKGAFKINNGSDRIVILAPGHFSDAEFAAMINEQVFDNKATILHYDPKIENTQNFHLFYGEEIGKADRIYFADEAITSGIAFTAANSFLKQVLTEYAKKQYESVKAKDTEETKKTKKTKKTEITKGFDACLLFMNRSSYYGFEDIKRKLGHEQIYAFTDLYIPYITFNNKCPLCEEIEKYKKLYENSYLTRIKMRFLVQQNKLRVIHINSGETYKPDISDDKKARDEKNERVLKKAEAMHRIYALFSGGAGADWVLPNAKGEMPDFYEWVDSLLKRTKTPFNKPNLKKDKKARPDCILSETQIAILKNLTQAPFYNYKAIREKSFRWVIELLEYKIEQIRIVKEKRAVSKDSVKELKLLIRRATLLNSNYIMSYKLFFLLELLYDSVENEGDKRKEELRKFSVFFAAQINELLHNNEARSIELENRLEYFEKRKGGFLFKQLIQILREENGAIIRTFVDFFMEELRGIPKAANLEDSIKDRLKGLGKYFRYTQLSDFLERTKIPPKGDISKDPALLKFLVLKKLLKQQENDGAEKELLKQQKNDDGNESSGTQEQNGEQSQINRFLKLLHDIVEVGINININKEDDKEVGCFAIVKYKQNNKNTEREDDQNNKNTEREDDSPYFLVYNEGKDKEHIDRNEEDFLDEEKSLIKLLEKGEIFENYEKFSIIEFCKVKEGEWQDLLFMTQGGGASDDATPTLKDLSLPTDCNRLLLLRIDKDKLKDKVTDVKENVEFQFRGQAVIGFYFKDDSVTPTDIQVLRYLLLLRSDISKYLTKHLDSDAFRDYIENKKKVDEALTSDHDYNNILLKLKEIHCKLERTNDNGVYSYLHSLIAKREILKRTILLGKIDGKDIDKEVQEKDSWLVNIPDEIKKTYDVVFGSRPCANLKYNDEKIPKDLKIEFPLFIFRAVLYEYIKNANSCLIDITNPFLNIEVKVNSVDDNDVDILIINNIERADFDELLENKERLTKFGYIKKGTKGLYKNSRLLKAAKCNYPKISFTSLGNNNFEFTVQFNTKKYEHEKN